MAQDLSTVKANVASQLSSLSSQMVSLINNVNEVIADFNAYNFASGQANQYQQADLVGNQSFLTPLAIANGISALQTVTNVAAPPAGVLNSLRLMCQNPPI